MTAKQDLTKLSDAELTKAANAHAKVALEAKDLAREYAHEQDRRATQKAAEDKAAALTGPEREALRQVLGPVGIESQESVGSDKA